MKNITILGSTGSIGKNVVEVIKSLRKEFNIVNISGHSNIELLIKQAKEFKCKNIVCTNKDKIEELKERVKNDNIKILYGIDGMTEISIMNEIDMVICATSGIDAMIPIINAIENKKNIAIANKEIIVVAGNIIIEKSKEYNVKILPIDSEHCGIFQCIDGIDKNKISKIILTSSGGPLRNFSDNEILNITYDYVINNHPTWKMGEKITVDSATMMNKAFEIIEAKWLFGLKSEQIEVVIHSQSIVHALVEFIDGTILAQISETDMKIPIQYAITYPYTFKNKTSKSLNLLEINSLTFKKIDRKKVPNIDLAYYALQKGGTIFTVMNTANDFAIEQFKLGKIRIVDISNIVKSTMEKHIPIQNPNIKDIINAKTWTEQLLK